MPKKIFLFWTIFAIATVSLYACDSDPAPVHFGDLIEDPIVSPGELGDLTDLGDLVQPLGDNWYFTQAVAINGEGMVAGTSNPGFGIFLGAFRWNPVTELMTPVGPTGECSEAVGINSAGEVIGNVLRPCSLESAAEGFIWSNGPIIRFNALGGFVHSEAIDINDRGHVAVYADGWAYYWDRLRFRPLCGILGATSAVPVAINENLHAVVNSGGTAVFHDLNYDKCESLNHLPIGPPEERVTFAIDINDSQYLNHDEIPDPHIIGNSGIDDNGDGEFTVWEDNIVQGFFWDGGAMYPVDDLGGGSSVVVDMNNFDQVAGNATTADKSIHAFLWTLGEDERGIIRDLGTLGGRNSFATAINEAGQVVGYSETGTFYTEGGIDPVKVWHAFLWDNGVMYDLGVHNDFYDYPFVQPYPFSEAVDINAGGDVAGNSITINRHYRGFYLSPVFP